MILYHKIIRNNEVRLIMYLIVVIEIEKTTFLLYNTFRSVSVKFM